MVRPTFQSDSGLSLQIRKVVVLSERERKGLLVIMGNLRLFTRQMEKFVFMFGMMVISLI